MGKDWTGNTKSVYSPLGASSHVQDDRAEHDFYATDPIAMNILLNVESFNRNVWECAVGAGHLARVLEENGYNVRCSDIIDRGYPNTQKIDFLRYNGRFNGDIITNPPYKFASQFLEKAMDIIGDGNKVAMFLKLTFLEGKERKEMFKKYPPKTIYVSSSRINCAKNGNFDDSKSSAVAYAWYIWEKGFTGNPIVKWVN